MGVSSKSTKSDIFHCHVSSGNQAMSALFGYYLRKADVRYQLDKIVLLGRGDVGIIWNYSRYIYSIYLCDVLMIIQN